MQRSVLFGLALGVVVGASGSAQAVVLRYAPAVGTTSQYAYRMTSRIQATTGTAAILSEMTLQAAATYRVEAKVKDGLRVQMTLRETTVTVSAPGGSGKQAPQKKPDATLGLLVTPRGRVYRMLASGARAPSGSLEDLLTNLLSSCAFPDKDVEPGARWADRMETRADSRDQVTLTRTCELLEVAPYRGRPCAKIRVTYGGTLGAGAESGGADVQGGSTQYYDYQRGVWVEVESGATMTLKRPAAPKGASSGGKPPTATRVTTVTLSMRLKK